jgi:hypothetical protein
MMTFFGMPLYRLRSKSVDRIEGWRGPIEELAPQSCSRASAIARLFISAMREVLSSV